MADSLKEDYPRLMAVRTFLNSMPEFPKYMYLGEDDWHATREELMKKTGILPWVSAVDNDVPHFLYCGIPMVCIGERETS